tara:strand:+ start:506 stop:1180 length:675 start_codon:yes stop_codon:yes gene_type:complete
MSFFLEIKSNTIKCPNGCKLFNDKRNFSYWESKNVTKDEKYIVDYLNINSEVLKNKNILHVGIGNSYIAKKLLSYNKIDGISLSQNELDYASKLNLSNYNFFFQNKYAYQKLFDDKLNFYNIIIDINLKSFSCCEVAFDEMFKMYVKIINKDGKIITSRTGLEWSRIIKPVLSFSFKNFLYKRLKEFDGPESNILSIQNCEEISKKFNLDIDLSDQNLVIFTKK